MPPGMASSGGPAPPQFLFPWNKEALKSSRPNPVRLPPSPAPLLEFLWPFYLVLYKFQERSATSFKQDEAVDT